MQLLKKFQKHLSSFPLFTEDSTTLLAISGGVDSMVMGELFYQAGLDFAIAHCNFHLRGTASDADELLVEEQAEIWDVPYHVRHFDTKAIVAKSGESMQVVARRLRYDWFRFLLQNFDYQQVATAHHQNDAVETVLYNFTKGCGIKGLHGILPRRDHIVRPLLFATKEDIAAFAKYQRISYREDASNATNKYARNLIRNQVVPLLEQINPNFITTGTANIQRLRETEQLYDYAIDLILQQAIIATSPRLLVDIDVIKNCPAPLSVLHELLKEKGFTATQIAQVATGLKKPKGQIFVSNTHRLLINRTEIIVEKITTEENNFVLSIKEFTPIILHAKRKLKLSILEHIPTSLKTPPNEVLLDADQVKFPLTLRKWRAGDVFQPLGMQGRRQKVQDYFTNNKIDRFQREKIWLLCSDQQICWIMGWRVDERFKITSATKQVLRIEWV